MGIRHTAEVTDPITGEVARFEAQTAQDLEALIEQHLEAAFPAGDSAEPSPTAPDGPFRRTRQGPGHVDDDAAAANPDSRCAPRREYPSQMTC